MMEGLEKRELLAAEVFLPDVSIPIFSGPRNVGTVQANTVFESETIAESGQNDSIQRADFINLGTGPGQLNTIDLSGSMPFTVFPNDPTRTSVDLDTFAFDLRGGDILDIATLGSAGTIDVFYSNGARWFGTDTVQSGFYPPDSPLQTLGNSVIAQVVPEDGRYFLTVSPIDTTANYTLGLRAYRPVVEDLPVSAQQVIFLDFDGGLLPNSALGGGPIPGLQRYPSLQESLPFFGIDPADSGALNQVIDRVVEEVQFHFDAIGAKGGNGDFNRTGNAGEYGVTILNSRDHLDPGQHPLVTRVLVGGDSTIPGLPVNGFSTTLDVGNFSMDDVVVTVVDNFPLEAQLFPISPRESVLTAIAVRMAATVSHEAAHSFGMRHTDNTNNVASIIDSGGSLIAVGQRMGIGPDGIFGTLDDVRIEFRDDTFTVAEGIFGVERTLNAMSYTLATGTIGNSISGRVFSDANRDGVGSGDRGIVGATVFADVNGNGVADPNEPTSTTDVNGNYTLTVRPGTVNVIAVTPQDFSATTPTTVSAGAGASGVNFGFNEVVASITGNVYSDSDGDAIRDSGEGGVEDIFLYLDLDGDNRADLGEPSTKSAADGTYTLAFPGPGTYTIRAVVPPGFELTSPPSGEHLATFDGVSLNGNFDFGFLPSTDFGDAPDSYGTTIAVDGASHGITSGLTIGATVDREIDGQPSIAADGDGADEDGVRLLSPLGPGDTATLEVTVNNTTGTTAFLQGFMDFNGDGDFTDAGEQFASNVEVASGTVNAQLNLPVAVPAGAAVGTSYARFRLSQTTGIGPTGFATTGEVEDYTFSILDAAEIANDDEFTVSRNSLSNPLNVLGNDFETSENQLTIQGLNTIGTQGQIVIAGDQKSLFYTPKNGFIGRDVFGYTVRDQFGNVSSANVVVNVSFQSNIPIALDDTFEIAEGSVNRPLNVLDNDVPSNAGGVTITSVAPGDQGGTITIIGGGQSLRYTPLPGFNGTEQFNYSIQDSVGSVSTATVTVNMLPGSRFDDIVDFTIGIFDPVNINTPVSNVQVGEEVLVRVFVDHIEPFANPDGVAAAFLDLLYTDELVATTDNDNDPNFPFDVTFGPLFSGVFQQASSQTPGLIDEIGGLQSLTNQVQHSSPVELFTLRMQAVSPGVATFAADPADSLISETAVIGSDVALTPSQLRLGTAELVIAPSSPNFTSAIDDSFPDGLDSNGAPISAGGNRLDVLANDNLGPTGTIREFFLESNGSLGTAVINQNGTPSNLNDDFVDYFANNNVSGLERFSYVIITDDGIRSTAEVTMSLGNNNANAEVALDFALVSGDGSGTPISGVSVGERFGVQIIGEDLRINSTIVFAGFLDVLYDAGIIQPANTNTTDSFDFDVDINPRYTGVAGAGTAARQGIIDEFGAAFATAPSSPDGIPNPGEIATIFFTAVAPGVANVVGSPADTFPAHDTLLLNEDDPVEVSRIRYDSLQINVSGSALQNFGLPQDVNNDGTVSTIDALLIINTMNREATAEGEQVPGTRYYTDVNGDEKTSALDALQVINYLRRAENLSSGEGELIAPLNTSSPSGTSSSTDAVFAGLEEDDSVAKVVGGATASSPLAASVIVSGDSSDADDDDEDVLNLLADDISELWG